MAKGFTLEINPVVYIAKYREDGKWDEQYIEKPHLGREDENRMTDEKKAELLEKRNSFPELPLVNYTTQYGFGCFEGLKAFPQKDGGLRLFRPDENAKRMAQSMEGLMMPVFPVESFINAVKRIVAKNQALGFTPIYDKEWEKDDFVLGHSMYIRPFSYSEPGIGLNLSHAPWVVMVTTAVGAYFMPGNSKAKTTEMVRAYPKGTGWIKCNANYVTSTLAKKRAMSEGYMEAVFLDAANRQYIEEGSSCNIFFLIKNDTLVTPELGDTVLPGITRKSILQIAKDNGLETEERKISIEEVMTEVTETFVTGTASGVCYIESMTHNGKTKVFGDGKIGERTRYFLKTLKGIQYGKLEDRYGWMMEAAL
ncbi:MAG: branched-chain-amino-acid transaminase [Spirochaetales bacterium]|nr:branched-chain-amino-acid transaminase [Spirochaetales bacterium]